jgi:diaminohydroxyphosphoribosylaminopyrimidine deaminase / 5-amino-6-(5-phosphoribosylamino)uracil reductase
VTPEDDARLMRLALALGARGIGNTWPNPAVGCVLVQGARIVGRGWTQRGGRPHAEVMALQQAGPDAHGATAYVTLEPCAHHGKTPPCAEALIAAGVTRVVTALTDPDDRVAGRGHALLRAAGVEVVEGVEARAAAVANAGFLSRITLGRPMVTLKLASTLDGRIATVTGESRWITGPEARRAVHAMRLRHDAVMVGGGTARADDPDLTVRDLGARGQPVRIVIDSALRHSPQSRLGRTARDVPVWLCHTGAAGQDARAGWAAVGAVLIECQGDALGRVDIADALARLGARGLTRVFCEGGAGLAASLVAAGCADEIAWFTAGRLIGGDGVACLADLGVAALVQAPAFRLTGVERLGDDILHRWRRVDPAG